MPPRHTRSEERTAWYPCYVKPIPQMDTRVREYDDVARL